MVNRTAKQEKIELKIKEIISRRLRTPVNKIKSTDTIQSLGGDSLEFVEIILGIEEEFAFLIPAEEADNFKTIGDLIKYVKDNL